MFMVLALARVRVDSTAKTTATTGNNSKNETSNIPIDLRMTNLLDGLLLLLPVNY
jgi:hypothetical protein